ncbi:hypothetical protein P2H44_08170 [Albimonas sp. CAU 1670]|uniref:hypothetical protein n=1 Tax=Albimonas sp. CAU 1670 TaxID=3032599 RepID=UPI0023D99F97|nr:hypothetical protein [Albimonas sp. CAU 1670]MDF2232525.1 hypothetical protein [Albimonas sp. CAU 1670]
MTIGRSAAIGRGPVGRGRLGARRLGAIALAATAAAAAPWAAQARMIGGVELGGLTDYLFVFTDGSADANWQGASKGFVGDVAIDGVSADERTSGTVPYTGTIYTNSGSLGAWQNIVNANPSTAAGVTGETARIAALEADLAAAFSTINGLTATTGFAGVAPTFLDNLDVANGIAETFVVDITSAFQVSSQIDITGDSDDVFILRWDTDSNFGNGYDGQVKFQSGGGFVPKGGLTPSNFIHVAGDINASGGGSTPAELAPYFSGLAEPTNGGGFFTGYWLTTGKPSDGTTTSLSNAIFAGGWYSSTTSFSMTSGTSGAYVAPPPSTSVPVPLPAALLASGIAALGLTRRRRRG